MTRLTVALSSSVLFVAIEFLVGGNGALLFFRYGLFGMLATEYPDTEIMSSSISSSNGFVLRTLNWDDL